MQLHGGSTVEDGYSAGTRGVTVQGRGGREQKLFCGVIVSCPPDLL